MTAAAWSTAGGYCTEIAMDLEKAFETVPRGLIVAERLDIPGTSAPSLIYVYGRKLALTREGPSTRCGSLKA